MKTTTQFSRRGVSHTPQLHTPQSHTPQLNRPHHRRSIRLKGYDYSADGLYFITICTKDRQHLFGHVANGEMVLNETGQIVKSEWLNTVNVRQGEVIFMILSLCPTIFMPSSKFAAVGAYRIRPNRIRPNRIRPNHIRPNHIRPNHIRPNHIRPNRIRPNCIRPTMTTYRIRPTMTTYRIRPTTMYAIRIGAYAIRPYGHRPKRWVPLCGDSNPPCLKKSDFRRGNVITTNILSVILVILKKSQTIMKKL